MSRFNLLFSLIISIFFLLGCVSVYAQTTATVVERHIIISPTPKAGDCVTVKGHWEGEGAGAVWVDTQTICPYANRSEGLGWVESYWTCTVYSADGTCSTWERVPGHWIKTLP